MKIVKVFRLLRLSWIEYKLRKLNYRKHRLSLKFGKDFENIPTDKAERLVSELDQLKNLFSSFNYSVGDDYDE